MVHRPEDRENYTLLCAVIRDKLDSLSAVTGQDYLLSIAAPASVLKVDNFELPELSSILDFINIMAYDYHGPWGGDADAYTNFNAALYPTPSSPTMEPYKSYFNVSATTDSFVAAGVPKDKINLGLAFYGRGYNNATAGTNGLFSAHSGPSSPGTWEDGVYDFDDLYDNYIDLEGFTRYWSDEAKVPWLHNGNIFISYDDTMSIGYKTRYIRNENLGGAMFWELSCDRESRLLDKIYDVFNSPFAVEESRPKQVEFINVYPNPFNSACRIKAPEGSIVNIFDTRGNKVATLAGGLQIWTPEANLPSGIYLVNVEFQGIVGSWCSILYLK